MERTHGRERDEKGRFIHDEDRSSLSDEHGARGEDDRSGSRGKRVYGAGYAARDEQPDDSRRGSRDRH